MQRLNIHGIQRVVISSLALAAAMATSALGQAAATEPAKSNRAANTNWKPAPTPLSTPWAEQVTPENVWPQYPRPTLKREQWLNLNGLWDFSIVEGSAAPAYDSKILVPFPVESSLSGVGKRVTPSQTIWYRRAFAIPAEWSKLGEGRRMLLHFGAVDWACSLQVNGKEIGKHQGGYDPFSFDISTALREGENEVTLKVTDPTNVGGQPRGKQWDVSGGIWYTSVSGIWQTVWLEPIPAASIADVRIKGSAAGLIESDIRIDGATNGLTLEVSFDGASIKLSDPGEVSRPKIQIADPKLWSPERPHLYNAEVVLKRGDAVVDRVKTYFACRDIAVGKDAAGVNRLLLNGKPLFQFGPLDQGYWPDGLYTPPNEEAMVFDLKAIRKFGCNMLRKHVKVESELYYTWCDRLGILVWQDIPSPFFASGDEKKSPKISDEWKANFEAEAKEIVQDLGRHPSIVMWVPWNEGWGQNDLAWSRSMAEKVKTWDPTRLVNNASGWTDMGVGDTMDYHAYPDPACPPLEAKRAAVLGEFGGLGLPMEGHTWLTKDNWGYKTFPNRDALTAGYIDLLKQIPDLIADGLCAAVYTQTTDVEIEVNGWLTYDRRQWKVDPERVRAATAAMYNPAPSKVWILPHAGRLADADRAEWRFTTNTPAAGWEKPGFDAAAWGKGRAGFGSKGTPGAIVGTEWKTGEIWIRRDFELGQTPDGVKLSMYHDEDAEVYLNGVPAVKASGYTTAYRTFDLTPEARAALKAGTNTIAIHCRQTRGGQGVDAGLFTNTPGSAAGK